MSFRPEGEILYIANYIETFNRRFLAIALNDEFISAS